MTYVYSYCSDVNHSRSRVSSQKYWNYVPVWFLDHVIVPCMCIDSLIYECGDVLENDLDSDDHQKIILISMRKELINLVREMELIISIGFEKGVSESFGYEIRFNILFIPSIMGGFRNMNLQWRSPEELVSHYLYVSTARHYLMSLWWVSTVFILFNSNNFSYLILIINKSKHSTPRNHMVQEQSWISYVCFWLISILLTIYKEEENNNM